MNSFVKTDLDPERLCQYNIEWLVLKEDLQGHWLGSDNVNTSIIKLNHYISRDRDSLTRVWRVLTLFENVLLGYNSKHREETREYDQVKRCRDGLKGLQQYLREKGRTIYVDTPEQIISDWSELPEKVQKRVRSSLEYKLTRHRSSLYKRELQYFLDLVSEGA
jgi:hypothetical protein